MHRQRDADGDAKPLVVVAEAFAARGGGVVVEPRVTVHARAGSAPFAVRLRKPDGAEVGATATLDVAHIRGPNGAYALVRILGPVEPADVPRGTEVWRG
jgi:hypothetical protein